MDTVFGLTCPRTKSTGHQQRIGHGCTHVLTFFLFFFLWKMMNMVGTHLGHDLCPKRKLKCIVPLMTISSHTNLLLLLQFLDLFLFYGFSPFTLFHWFVCVCLLLFCLPHNHTWRAHLSLTSTWTKDVRLVLLFKYLSFMIWSPPLIQPAS